MNVAVVDASVILKWVLEQNEEDLEHARAIQRAAVQGKLRILVPPLWRFEVGNTLVRKVPDHAETWLHLCETSGLEEMSVTDEVQAKTVELCRKHGVTFYDASYHALALVSKGTFVTADERYVAKAKLSGSVVHLSEFEV